MANHPNRSRVPDWPEYVKRLRERHALSQVQLAGELKVEETTVQRWWAGERTPAPYLKRALRDLARELEKTNRILRASAVSLRGRRKTMTTEQHTPEPWAYDEADARIYYADGDVEPTIAYVERENTSPERVKLDGYPLAAAPKLLTACKTLAQDCRMALSGEWDKSDAGFSASLELLESVILQATGSDVIQPGKTVPYTVSSSHGELTIDAEGLVIARDLDNNDADGGGHLACITRFDLAEWRKHWGNPDTTDVDILDIGYWYANPSTGKSDHAPPDARWRSEIAEVLLERHAEAAAS